MMIAGWFEEFNRAVEAIVPYFPFTIPPPFCRVADAVSVLAQLTKDMNI